MTSTQYPSRTVATGEKMIGKYKGIVDDNNDLTQSGKLKVIIDGFRDGKPVWADPCVPYADRGLGFFFMPPNQTEVWVEFEQGDRTKPIWTGFLWPAGGAPVMSKDEMVIATPSGSISFNAQSAGGEITLKTEQLTVELRDGTVTIKAGQSTTIEINSQGSVSASSGGVGKVEIGSSGTKINGTSLEVS
ncbi:phage baseplate assembly protein V [Flavimaricola marinus]|uniref:Phage-related baseplate assembly protein n=1 Tax=Flavimaricola marinus TaxID=1819565 RepID=A0A238L9K2_9RHOB|nr:phage baseplate assembly protein V [Flavimaricola marinus]SMY06262.1 Phage-related baseplate assembly protein [Flavimaricola marinus]